MRRTSHPQGFQAIVEPSKTQVAGNLGNSKFPLFTKERLKHLYRFMSQSQINVNPSLSPHLAQTCNFLTTLHTSKSNPWITDS